MKKTIQSGIYLVIDPSIDRNTLLTKLQQAITGKIVAVQIWDNFKTDCNVNELISEISTLCRQQNIPVLINNQWRLLLDIELDGVHFDTLPDNFNQLKQDLGKEMIIGITCGNDLSVVKWADENKLDYISFCSMFPSTTANSCELVTFDNIKEARKITSLPIFLAGGVKPENIPLLNELSYSGIAIVSGIMNADNPIDVLKMYYEKSNLSE
ncbi:MAG TPA: thiamine phosphate synthase [Phnomibacter sp.]|nr:thiamine phosphate synthase [Phnomibacter sp.]